MNTRFAINLNDFTHDAESADKIKEFLKSNNIQLHDIGKNTTYTII